MARKSNYPEYQAHKLTKELAKKLLAEYFPIPVKDLVKESGTRCTVYTARFGHCWVELSNDAVRKDGFYRLYISTGGSAGKITMYIDADTLERSLSFEASEREVDRWHERQNWVQRDGRKRCHMFVDKVADDVGLS